jgi:8-oxo-dGTP pyrophosphatase MutT (NUDIX family)
VATVEVQRVAVRVVTADGAAVAAGWLRHGDTPIESLARVLRRAGVDAGTAEDPDTAATDATVDLAASMPLRSARSIPRDVPERGVLVHLLALDYSLPPGLRVAESHDETVDRDHLDQALTSWADGGRRDPLGAQAGRGEMKVQRAGAYLIAQDGGWVLLTRLARSGRWTLPGGGIDVGEQPEASLVREVYEETGLEPAEVRLVEATTACWTGRAPDGVVEDFQAVQVLYTATVATDVEPRVVEVGGSTGEVAWVDLVQAAQLRVTYAARSGLRLLGVRLPG